MLSSQGSATGFLDLFVCLVGWCVKERHRERVRERAKKMMLMGRVGKAATTCLDGSYGIAAKTLRSHTKGPIWRKLAAEQAHP